MIYHGTTILGILRDDEAVIAGDGQVTLGDTIVKSNSQKVRYLADKSVLAGFAGAAADGFTLLSRFEEKLAEKGDLLRAAVELAKDWRTDRYLRRLEAELIVLNKKTVLLLTGGGDVLEPEDGVVAIGSGAGYAIAAARAMLAYGKKMPLKEIAENALKIAAKICVYTNEFVTILELP